MKIYAVIVDISFDFNNTITLKLFKNEDDARKFMVEKFEKTIEDLDFDTIERGDDRCTAYESGYYVENHCEVFIKKEFLK